MNEVTIGVVFAVGWIAAAMGQAPTAEQLPSIKDLPDPFILNDGSRVKNQADWAKRREQIKELVQIYEYGHLPPKAAVTVAAITSRTIEGGATEKLLVLNMGGEGKVSTHLFLTTPAGKGPFPVIVTGDLGWGRIKDSIVAEVVKRGYMLAEFSRVEIAPDGKDFRDRGVLKANPDCDGACLAAWAWGYHRVIDYLYTLNEVDKTRIAITGHSRGGKATLLAGAMDERIALTAPNNSGCGGAGCYRQSPADAEDIARITKAFPFWFSTRFPDFIGKIDRLPLDQHTLKALVAPRALLSTEALGDRWANPEGTQQTYLAAKVVFDWLGAADKLGIFYREGKHEQNEGDWRVLLDFADRVFFKKESGRKFDQLAFPNLAKMFSWTAPQ